jgi:hypothetical protein
MTLNPCELEIDLFCCGIRIPDGVALTAARGLARTRAGLGSGLEITIPTGSRLKPAIWMNAPVVEPFAQRSPYVLEGSPDSGYIVRDTRNDACYPIEIPDEPEWYSRTTSGGVEMSRIGVLQGTYLAIYVNPICTFWNARPSLNCRFCTTGRNVGVNEVAHKTHQDIFETCVAAREESGVTFVHFNGGFEGRRTLDTVEPLLSIAKDVGLLAGVQLTPDKDFSRYDRLIDLGADHVSFCLEFFDPAWFERLCPGKARVFGQDLFFEAAEYCVARMPRGAVSIEMIAGAEPIEHTLEAIDRITSIGAFPTVCIFRPTIGSDMQDWPPPSYTDMRTVMQAVYDGCRKHWLPIGVAPNIEVSLVVNPDDAAFVAVRTAGFYAYEAWRRTARAVLRPAFNRKLTPRTHTPALPGTLAKAVPVPSGPEENSNAYSGNDW